jgi:hypothetical protein
MDYDELVATIKSKIKRCRCTANGSCDYDEDQANIPWDSLLDIARLHKPKVHIADCCKDTANPMDCSESYISCEGCRIYPCPTIKIIEETITDGGDNG